MDSKPTILVVDDNPVNLELLEQILRLDGYRVITAENGKNARKLAITKKPDLILLDIMMPGETGFQTCTKLKQDPRTSEIAIIFVSAIDDVDSKVKGLTIGGVDYITKPFAQAEVLVRTRLHLNLKLAYQAFVEMQAEKLKQLQDAQQAILVNPSDLPEAKFGVCYKPINEAGGDFYDVLKIGDGIYGFFVADISGHDLGASYLTSALKALINQNTLPGITPVETMTIINRVLTKIMKDGQHLTCCYAHLNRNLNRLTVISAGHPPAIYVSSKQGQGKPMEGTGDILGAFESVVFEPVEKRILPGDRVYLYSDGLIEAFGEKNKRRDSGIKELIDTCASTMNLPVEQAVDQIIEKLFPADHPPQDDLVLLGIEC